MIIASKKLELPRAAKLVIVPLSDIHHNALGHDREKFQEIIEWVRVTSLRKDRRVVVLTMGDELDTFSGSERRAIAAATALHESSRLRIEKMVFDDLRAFIDDVAPIKHLIAGSILGNHVYRFQEADMGTLVGKTTTRVIAESVGAPYFGKCGSLILELSPGDRSTARFPYKILLHHGFGGGGTKGNSINQMVKLKDRFPAFDCYIMGHNHIPIGTTQPGIDVRYNARTGQWRMVERQQAFIRAGSFLKGYIEGQAVEDSYGGSYVEDKCLVPQGLGVVTANLRWKIDKATGNPKGFIVHTQE